MQPDYSVLRGSIPKASMVAEVHLGVTGPGIELPGRLIVNPEPSGPPPPRHRGAGAGVHVLNSRYKLERDLKNYHQRRIVPLDGKINYDFKSGMRH